MQELLEVAEKNTRTSVEFDEERSGSDASAGRQAKWMDFWGASMGTGRANADAMMQIGTRASDTWIDFVQRNSEVTQMREAKRSMRPWLALSIYDEYEKWCVSYRCCPYSDWSILRRFRLHTCANPWQRSG